MVDSAQVGCVEIWWASGPHASQKLCRFPSPEPCRQTWIWVDVLQCTTDVNSGSIETAAIDSVLRSEVEELRRATSTHGEGHGPRGLAQVVYRSLSRIPLLKPPSRNDWLRTRLSPAIALSAAPARHNRSQLFEIWRKIRVLAPD